MVKPFKPGADNVPPGKYREVGPRGGRIPNERIVTIDEGDRLPPTKKAGDGWLHMTPHKSGTDNLPAGKYIEVGPNGEKLEKDHIISIDRGDRLPPVKKAGNGWFRM